MSVRLGSNIASLGAQRRLAENTSALSRTFERLSSGQRINRASDDAAGLAIADSLRADSRLFNQGVRNLNDGISLLNIADSAIENLSGIMIRMEELAEQAANGTYGVQQRKALDAEAQALSKEFFRISKSTNFNGRNVLSGEIGTVSLQGGIGTDAILSAGVGGAIGTASFTTSTSYSVGDAPNSVTTGDFNGDGLLDVAIAEKLSNTMGVLLGNGNGTFGSGVSNAVGTRPNGITTADLNGDGNLDLVTADILSDAISVLIGVGNGTFGAPVSYAVGDGPTVVSTGDFNGDGVLDLATSDISSDSMSVLLGRGNGTFAASVSYVVGSLPASVSNGDFNGDGVLDLVTADRNSDTTSVLLGLGNGTFAPRISYAVGDGPFSVSSGDFNGDGVLDLVTSDIFSDTASVLLGLGNGTFAASVSYAVGDEPRSVAIGDFNGDGVFDLITANYNADTTSVLLGQTKDGVAPLLSFSLKTMADARQALPVFKRKREQLAAQRGQIGAFQSRIGVAVNVLQVTSENFKAAESRIRDADIASESSQLVRLNILQQAASSVLAQANQQPALALKLLGAG